ncbi:MAG: hypothetical protein RL362_1605 [Bacteroidota bacterium]|jgi:hypothetical protein
MLSGVSKDLDSIYLIKIEHYEKINFDHWIVYAFNGMSQV